MREYKKPLDIIEALALVDKHMGGSQPMKRLLELLAANYPDVPMPYICARFRLPNELCVGAIWLRFPLPLNSSDICVAHARTLPGMSETFCVCVPWNYFWIFDSEVCAAETIKTWIHFPKLCAEIQSDAWTRTR